jgi:general secretion pathway protein L
MWHQIMYYTLPELRIETDKAADDPGQAARSVGLVEEPPHFTRATFFALRTRSPADPGERFHMEARIRPVFSPRS